MISLKVTPSKYCAHMVNILTFTVARYTVLQKLPNNWNVSRYTCKMGLRIAVFVLHLHSFFTLTCFIYTTCQFSSLSRRRDTSGCSSVFFAKSHR